MPKERPILFSEPMVKALQAGQKFVTRRIVKPQPVDVDEPWPNVKSHLTFADIMEDKPWYGGWCPYGMVGDHLWVKEGFRLAASIASDEKVDLKFNWGINHVYYRADQEDVYAATDWKPSLFMPRWASRFTLRITGIGIEQVQDITETEAMIEGVRRNPKALDPETPYPARQTYRTAYRLLWDELNGKKHPWASNPYVWTIRFEPV